MTFVTENSQPELTASELTSTLNAFKSAIFTSELCVMPSMENVFNNMK
jgi:hypothetical protein